MQVIFLIYLTIFGLIFGSFGSVLIYRLYSGEKGILLGRSHCGNCNHTLGVLDLFPIFSYLFLGAKCRYCKKVIPIWYPLLEVMMGIVFYLIGLYLIDYKLIFSGDKFEIARLLIFMFIGFVLVIISYTDIFFKRTIPMNFLAPSIGFLLIMHLLGIFIPISEVFSYFRVFENSNLNISIVNGFLGSFFVYSFFYLQIYLSIIYYAFKEKKYIFILKGTIEYFTLPFILIHELYIKDKKETQEENFEDEEEVGVIGYGDLWIGVFMGFAGGFKIAALGLIMAYLLGSIVGIYILFIKRQRNQRIAFGPFLGAGFILALICYDKIIMFYFNLIKLN